MKDIEYKIENKKNIALTLGKKRRKCIDLYSSRTETASTKVMYNYFRFEILYHHYNKIILINISKEK